MKEKSEPLLASPELTLRIRVLERMREGGGGPYLEWLHLHVLVEVPGFEGKLRWEVMPGTLEQFLAGVEELYRGLEPDLEARMEGTYPGVRLSLVMRRGGHVGGEYVFASRTVGYPRLEGEFHVDQNLLPGLIKGLKGILKTPATEISL